MADDIEKQAQEMLAQEYENRGLHAIAAFTRQSPDPGSQVAIRVLTTALTRIERLERAAGKALNYIANTEGELGIKLDSGDALRAALAKEPRS